MPWIFNLPNGVTRQFPTQQEDRENGMSFAEAEARVRREINPRSVNTEDPSADPDFANRSPWAQNSLREAAASRQFFRDLGDQASGGIADIGTAFGQMVNILDPTASRSRREGRDPIGDMIADSSRAWGQEQMRSLSPEMLRDQNDGDWLNSGNVSATIVRSAPSLIPTLAAGIASGGSMVLPAAVEGVMGGGSVADTIDESIRDIAAYDPDVFIQSELGQQALAETQGDYPRAVELAANRAKGAAPVLAGAITAGLSRLGENVFRAGQGPARRRITDVVARIALGASREGLEETLQSSNEQIAGNLAISQIDDRPWDEGLAQAAVMGGIAGAGMGGGMGAVDVMLSNARRRRGPADPAGPAIDGPVMPPPGHPNRGPAEGDGNPEGWSAPDTSEAEDAEFTYPGENILEGGRTGERPGWKPGTESWADLPPEQTTPTQEPPAPPEEHVSRLDEEIGDPEEIDPADTLPSDFDEEYAANLDEHFQSLGMAAREMPPQDETVVDRKVEPVPLFRYNRDDIEGADEDALAIYRGAKMEDREISDTATFQAYSRMADSLFADEEGNPDEAAGYGLRVVDTLANGDQRVSYVATDATSAEEAAQSAGISPAPAEQAQEKASDNNSLTEELNTNTDDVSVRDDVKVPETGTAVEPKGEIKNLNPAANEALNTYRTKGESGLQAYLAGLNVTATRSLLRNLGGQGVRTDSLSATQAKIVAAVKKIARMAETRGMPAPANVPARDQEAAVTPPATADVTVREQEITPAVAPKATAPQRLRDKASALGAKRRTDTPERIKPVDTPKRIKNEDDTSKDIRSPAQLKSVFKELALLEDQEFDEAVSKVKITPEEAAAVLEAMKTDKGLDNLRPIFNEVKAAARKKNKKSRQTEENEPKRKTKSAKPKEDKQSPAKERRERDAGDRALAQSISRGQPKDYDVVRRAVEQWLEVERDRQGIRTDALWYKQWPLSRQEALINRTWNAVNGRDGAMESRDYGAGKTAGDLNPLQMFSRAERMARTFPEESSTRMHMVKWLERRVRKAELKFIDMSEFLHGGPTGNALRDKATRQELIDYISARKLRLTVRYAYGQPGGTIDYSGSTRTVVLWGPIDKAAEFAGFTQQTSEEGLGDLGSYSDYTLLGPDVVKHNYLEVGIVIEPGQPGSEYTGSHVGGKGAVAGMLISDYPITVNGKELNAMAVHQGQSDYHDAKPEQYGDGVAIKKRLLELRKELNRQKNEEGKYNDADWAEYRDLEYENGEQRNINAPYRETHPELMFRTAFMLAVSSDHDALVWPTADTIRMYEGHSTYKGDFYDQRWPKYAESWLREYKANVTKQEIKFAPAKANPDFTTVEEFVDETMRQEAHDIANDLIPTGVETNVDAAFGDSLDQLGYVLSESHTAWRQGLDMKGREGDASRPARFDVPYYEKALAEVKRAALAFLKENTSYHDDLFNEETSPSERDVKRVFTDFAETYLSRFVDVLEEAYDKEARKSGVPAEVYVMKITPEMKAAFRETGIPMFSKDSNLPVPQSPNRDIVEQQATEAIGAIGDIGKIVKEVYNDLSPGGQARANQFLDTLADTLEELRKELLAASADIKRLLGETEKTISAQALPAPNVIEGEFRVVETPQEWLPKEGAELFGPQLADQMQAVLEIADDLLARDAPIKAEDNPIPDKAWVNEMERAIKIAAACGAAQAGAGAAFGALAAGMALGVTAAAPIAALIAADAEQSRWMNDLSRRVRQQRRDAGLAPANDYLDTQGNYIPPFVDEEGYVAPDITVLDEIEVPYSGPPSPATFEPPDAPRSASPDNR